MKKYIVEKQMINNTDGYMAVVIEGETHLNRTVIKSQIQFFTTQGGYDYCHPFAGAEQNAQSIANGLNADEGKVINSIVSLLETEILDMKDESKTADFIGWGNVYNKMIEIKEKIKSIGSDGKKWRTGESC